MLSRLLSLRFTSLQVAAATISLSSETPVATCGCIAHLQCSQAQDLESVLTPATIVSLIQEVPFVVGGELRLFSFLFAPIG